ncbi:MAG: MFS transporter [Pseudomonadota bacterium]
MTPVPIHRDGRYVRIWFVGWCTGVIRWLELLAYGIYAFDVTGSPILVALVALIRFVPMALISLLFGAAADQISPRKILTCSLIGIGTVMALMTAISASDNLSYGWVLFVSMASGVFWASDMPTRRKMIGEIAGPDRLARAMSWDYATSNGTRMLGPLIGGVIYQNVGMVGIFGLGTVLYLVSIFLAAGIRPTGGRRGGQFDPTMTLVGSFRTLRRALKNNEAVMVMAVTLAFNVWGFPFVSMIPVIGKESLGLDPSWIGYITSVEGLIGLVAVLVLGVIARPWFFRRLYLGGLLLHLCCVGFIGFAPDVTSFALALAVAGFATAAFASMQSTLMYRIAPPGMKGRYLGLISICIGAGLIGFANVGLMAELFGAEAALRIIAAEGLIASLFIILFWRGLHVECRPSRSSDPGPAE